MRRASLAVLLSVVGCRNDPGPSAATKASAAVVEAGASLFQRQGLQKAYAAEVSQSVSPIVSAVAGVLLFFGGIAWFWLFFTRGDAWIRGRLGRRFGVTIQVGSKAHWRVGGGAKWPFLIELLQLPCILFAILVWGLWMGLGLLLLQAVGG